MNEETKAPEEVSETQRETILIAEDSAPNRKILEHLLKKMDYDVLSCEDGKVAWEYLEQNSDGVANLVCILSDIMMPNMDGLDFLKKVRESDKYQDLPFVLITAVSDRDYIVRAKTLNVNGYILKPVTFKRVSEKLKSLFPNKKFKEAA